MIIVKNCVGTHSINQELCGNTQAILYFLTLFDVIGLSV